MTGPSAPAPQPSIAVVGVGSVGGYLAARLAGAGTEIRLLARAAQLQALRRDGLRVTSGTDTWAAPPVPATDDPAEIGEVDAVFLCVKTWQLPPAIDLLKPMIGPATAVVTVQNGVQAPEQVMAAIGRDHVLPGLARIVARSVEPGHVENLGGPVAMAFAEWDGSTSERVLRLRASLRAAGVTALEPADIWAELWMKFLTVVPVGSLGAATGGASIGDLRSRAGTRELLIAGMRELHAAGVRLGIALPADALDSALETMQRQPAGATTSLQRDILAGRPSELEAWTGAAVRLAARAGSPAPVLGVLYELLAARTALSEKEV